jgi:hypothetical protein
MRPHDPDDERIKVLDELARGRLIALTDAAEAAGQIERQRVVVSHGRIEARTCTSGKTRVAMPGYRRNRQGNVAGADSVIVAAIARRAATSAGPNHGASLDISSVRRIPTVSRMQFSLQALRLTNAHDL